MSRAAEIRAEIRRLRAELARLEPVSPLAVPFPDIPAIDGVRLSAVAAGVRYQGRADVMLAELAAGSALAGVLTRSATRSASVEDCAAKLGRTGPSPIGILVNAGNANAFTGSAGALSVAELAEATAARLGTSPGNVLTSSTGTIGEPLPHDRIVAMLDAAAAGLAPDRWRDAAEAIRTTDTFAKGAVAQADGVTVAGIAKGSGMIAPDMATMLAYVFTDATVDPAELQHLTATAAEASFNAITVDSDTSTSDTVLVGATGRGPATPRLGALLTQVMTELAHAIVRDGEGATAFVEVAVTGAVSDASAKRVARAGADSPLVKTAIAGRDPNWGRVVMAIGKAGEPADRDRLTIHFGDVLVAERGWVSPSYTEAAGAAAMAGDRLRIAADLGLGDGRATIWTCDLTDRYIQINADYRS